LYKSDQHTGLDITGYARRSHT